MFVKAIVSTLEDQEPSNECRQIWREINRIRQHLFDFHLEMAIHFQQPAFDLLEEKAEYNIQKETLNARQ